jgi:uncharacterized membrane protein YfcA
MNIENSSNIILGVTCVAIALIATFSLIRKAKHPIVRTFFVKASIVFWGSTAVYGLGYYLLSQPYREWCSAIYGFGLMIGCLFLVWKRRHIVRELATSKRAA